MNMQKKERHQYPAILTEHAWSIKDLLYAKSSGNRERAIACSGSQSKRRIRFILRARRARL